MFVLSWAGSLRAVGAPRGKLLKRSAPLGAGPGAAAEGAGGVCCGRCHDPGWVRRGGGGYEEVAVYGFPVVG